LAIALVIAIWQLISLLWPRGEKVLARAEEAIRKPVDAAKSIFPSITALRHEEKLIKTRLERVTKKEIKESAEIIADLKEMQKIINEYGNLPVGRTLIAKKLNDIQPKLHYSNKMLKYIKVIDKKLKAFDISEYEKLLSQYNKLSKAGKALLEKRIYEKRKKLKCEDKIISFEKVVEKYQKDFAYAISQSVANLNAMKQKDAKSWLRKAIQLEETIYNEFSVMKKLEEALLALTKYELKTTKKKEIK
jgi:hypothetical protein